MRRTSIVASGVGSVVGEVLEEAASAPVDILPKEIDLTGDGDDKLPNTLVITVIQARNLQPGALRTTLSCYVKLSSLGREYKTSVLSKTDEPYWNETFCIRAVDWASTVTLSVRDKINVKMRFLGQARISCNEVSSLPGMSCQAWFRLKDKNWERKPGMEAEIELKVALVYSKKNDPSAGRDVQSAAAMDGTNEVIGIIADQDDETDDEILARRKELERLENERRNTLYSNLKQGDYQIQVHVIEARDLKGENLDGTSDPYVRVEILGTKKKTSTKYETLGCVFDEILFFHFNNIGRNELKQAAIKLSVYDREKLLRDNLIGSYQLDVLSVYFRPHHELYRQWIAVHDHLNEKDRGIQGFVLVSINVIGPGNAFLVHDREAEIAQELAQAAAALTDANVPASSSVVPLNPEGQSLILLPPTIELKLHFLVVKVFKAEDLPAMDEGGMILSSGIDAFVQIGFGVHVACKSSVVTVKGASHLSPEFLEELWIPVMSPTLSRHIAISVWDRDLGRKDELVGITAHDFQQVSSATAAGGILEATDKAEAEARRLRREALELQESEGGVSEAIEVSRVELRWFNLYGPPLKRINAKRALWIAQNPEFGSTYRGRVLLSMERVEQPMPEESEKFHVKRMQESLATYELRMPQTVKYVLRCALFCGTDLPQFPTLTSSTTRLRAVLSIGSFELVFDPQVVTKDGRANWEECKDRWPIILPADLTQLPDVIVTLSRMIDKDTFVSVSYARLSAAELFQQGFTTPCQWIPLSEELARRKTKYALDKAQSPGALLLRLGFGREEVAVRNPWGDDTAFFSAFRHHRVYREVRVNIYQVRKLFLPEDRTRLPNPFVSVKCSGQVKKTTSQYKTLDPLYYESLVFITHVPQDVRYAPDLLLHVHDANGTTSISTHIPHTILGELRLPMIKSVKAVANASPPRPSWYKLSSRASAMENPLKLLIDEPCGEALISIQHVDHAGPIDHGTAPERALLLPEYEESQLEIVALGVRKLKAFGVLGVRHPYVEFELTGGIFKDGSRIRKTRPAISSSGNGKNANLLEHLVIPVKLPVDTLFAPHLTIRVCEGSLVGMHKTVIASCSLPLASKLPWSSEYVPPSTQSAFEPPRSPTKLTAAPRGGSGAQDDATGTDGSRRKSILQMLGFGKSQRRQSQIEQHQEAEAAVAVDTFFLSDDEAEGGENGDKDQTGRPQIPTGQPEDDGIGIGDFSLPKISLFSTSRKQSATRLGSSTDVTSPLLDDPAMRDQLDREAKRRYAAGRSDMLRGGRGLVAGRSTSYGLVQSQSQLHDPGKDSTSTQKTQTPYLQGRDWWINQGGEELERFLSGQALETYPLYRSVLSRPSLLKRKRVRIQVRAGIFKGVIRVTEKRRSAKEQQPLVDLQRLKEPQSLVVRVYVLRGSNLQAKDFNGFSDPYLRLKLGKEIISDRANYKKKTLQPEFFRVFSFTTTLPGPSQLEIGVWDHDFIKKDDFIGSTTIDLEDRWFHREWQSLGRPESAFPSDSTASLKPIEYRHLYTPQRTTSQGFLQLWVDILTAQEATLVPPVSVAPPTAQKFEVRVVIWRAENVADKDHSEINDYFVKCWMEGGRAEDTDVHWRCSNGKPCWNWRFKFPVEFPMRTPELARLHVQLWDRDVIKWNDVLGEAQLDLYKWLRRAYETNRTVTPFYELKKLANGTKDLSGVKQAPVEETPMQENADDSSEEDYDEDDDDGDAGELGLLRDQDAVRKMRPRLTSAKAISTMKQKAAPHIRSTAIDKSAKQRQKEQREKNDARAALNGLLDFIGMGNLPDDAEWVTIYYTDRESAVSMEMGRIGVSVQIVPQKEAEMAPVGKGQEAPNVNPYLPPPVGRIRLTANPIMMLKELVGPKMCLRIAFLCCCVGCMFCVGVFGATIMSTLTFYEELTRGQVDNASHNSVAGPWMASNWSNPSPSTPSTTSNGSNDLRNG
ncbi:hypothetical protein Poli38472_008253 [Pythium oligandrum]|uniref:C2 domain-containing protein n=1 Tax=Pythium oligandrum TaxID=41045 RepID=A0A8K1FK37_PYTOL|nr:hypothetical protein Poli38472_008253 [Pythium oligandrum]|eukprot:TMW65611.1 hypothetical protein Poli38472_008253 [Pythium oligandrum]